MKIVGPRAVLFAAIVLCAAIVDARAAPLFADDAVIEIRLTGPIGRLLDSDPDERHELEFELQSEGVRHALKVRVRGNSRLRVCKFPPLRLNFAAGGLAGTVFEGQDKLKLVTHCRNDDQAEQDVLLEYLAYRIFNVLSDVSYRVRLVRMTYDDTDNTLDADARHRYGFFIEPRSELAARTGSEAVNLVGVARSAVDPDQAARVFIFQYMIGNTDWSMVKADSDEFCCHNVDLFDINDVPFLVPYDFDLSGLVNTRYAKPDPSLRISRVTKRLYRGYCISPGALRAALADIVAREDDIMALPGTIPGLSAREADTAARYLAKFFARAQDQRKLLRSFESRCL
jgi:hypothetical protein